MTDVRSISNPYEYNTHKLDRNSFVGRSDSLNDFYKLFDDFKSTGNIHNVIVSGDKSIGKSSLLHQYKKYMQNSRFFVFDKEVAGGADEYQFFKEIIDKAYTEVAPVEDTCLSAEQQDIWFCLTEYFEEHKSSFMEREIRLATIYSKYKEGKRVELDYNVIDSDFRRILTALDAVGYRGLAIIIDEFQELASNPKLLSLLRQLTENLSNVFIVGAGLPSILSNSNFDKFCRTSKVQYLKGLRKPEVVNLITKPLIQKGGLTKYQAYDLFDMATMIQVVDRGGGNPLHIAVLCFYMFENYKKDTSLRKIVLNSSVMDKVMDYYSNISEKSRAIKTALESCTYDDLTNLAQIYEYQNVAIRSILTHKNAFNPLSDSILEELKKDFLGVFEEVYKLGFFSLVGYSGTLNDLKSLSPAELASVEYEFVGDALDRLYVKYAYEKITKNLLIDNIGLRFEDLLAQKFGDLLYDELLTEKVQIDMTNVGGLFKALHKPTPEQPALDLQKDVSELSKISKSKKLSSEAKEKVMKISDRYQLGMAAHAAHSFGYAGYYSVTADISVKGKDRYVSVMCPVKEHDGTQAVAEQISDFTGHIRTQFDKYLVEVKSVRISWVPNKALTTILVVYRDDDYEAVDRYAKAREFDKCAVILDKVLHLTMRQVSDQLICDIDDYNNFGFCAMNAGALDKAGSIFDDCKASHIVAKINAAFMNVCHKKFSEAKKAFKSLIKQIPSDYECRFLNLAIIHDEILPKDAVIEDVRARVVILWNAALISSYLSEQHNISNSFLKQIKDLSDSEKCINKRVYAWVNYYRGNLDNSIKIAQEALTMPNIPEYLKHSIKNELQIFEKEEGVLSLD